MTLQRIFFVLCSISLVLVLISSPAFASAEVDKAKEFMAAGMYPQAIELLNKRINDKPTDAEAHFLAGTCYVNTGNYSGADERFGSAVKLQPDYGYKIGAEYKKAGDTLFNKGLAKPAQNAYQKAVQYQPQLKPEIAQRYFATGEANLNQGKSAAADEFLALAVQYDPSLNERKRQLQRDYANRLLATAKSKPRAEQKPYLDEAKKYLSQSEIEQVVPPPTWKSIPGFPKVFEGKGMGENQVIVVSVSGEQHIYGDKVVVSGEKFAMWKYDPPVSGEHSYISQSQKNGSRIEVRAPETKKFTVNILRLE
jgi:tetratricopeptide (TPR) repeat protein